MKLILMDLDETLLHSDKTISSYSISILKKVKSKGIQIGFCTSRGMVNIIPWVKEVQPDVIICNGGACIFYKDELIYNASFSLEDTRSILNKAYQVCGKNCEITLDTLDKIYWNRDKDTSQLYAPDAITDDFLDFSEQALKICVQTEDYEKAEQIASSVASCDFLPFSDIPWYKFSAGNATKEYSIQVLSKKINIPVEDIIAFGDDFNDIGMLKLCGKGIAMQNAIEQVKEIADYITKSNNDDGVAWYLENFCLEEI
ncbi:MAG: HAD family phosphatase [Spirochaetaceae bacterium]|nr:HAD family phosphatase [Spirochaetaceae bacterium]